MGHLSLLMAWVCLTGASAGIPQGGDALRRYEFSRNEMGTLFRIVLYTDSVERARRGADAAFVRIGALDEALSDYRDESELNRLSRSAYEAPQVVSLDLFKVLREASRISALSGGALDVTIKPIVRIWRQARSSGKLPAPDLLARALMRVGYRKVLLNPYTRSVRFSQPGVELDLGGIAKGYAADEACLVLSNLGIVRAMIDAGGDIRASGPPPGARGWVIDSPSESRAPHRLILSHRAVATSGDLYNFVELEGRRYSHIVDARTGVALTHRRLVRVTAPDALTADGWATALSVMEPARAVELVERIDGISVRIVSDDSRVWASR